MTALEAFTVSLSFPSPLSRQIKLSSLCHFFVHLDVNTSTHNGTFVQFTHTLKLVHSTRQGLEDPKRTSAVPDGSSSCAALLLSLSWANLNFCGWTARRCGERGRGIERGGQVCLLTVGCDCCTQSATHCYTRFSLPPPSFPPSPLRLLLPLRTSKRCAHNIFGNYDALCLALITCWPSLELVREGRAGDGGVQMETRPKTLVVEHALRFFICISLARLEELSSLFSRREF